MKLAELQELIFSDLTITFGAETFFNIQKYGTVFKSLKDREVIGIRASRGGHLEINIK